MATVELGKMKGTKYVTQSALKLQIYVNPTTYAANSKCEGNLEASLKRYDLSWTL